MSQPFDNNDWELRQIAEKDAEIERLKQYACQCEASVHSTQEGYAEMQAEIERLKELCARAEDALHWDNPLDHAELIAELRKAAQ